MSLRVRLGMTLWKRTGGRRRRTIRKALWWNQKSVVTARNRRIYYTTTAVEGESETVDGMEKTPESFVVKYGCS